MRCVPSVASLSTGMLIMVFGAGCTDGAKGRTDRPDVVEASGTLTTYKGTPVEGATVVLVPQEKSGYAASGLTDSSGRFELSAFAPDTGAVPGKYKMTVVKVEAPPAAAGPGGGHDDSETPPPRDLLPIRYKDAATSDLTAEIPEGGTSDLTFDLKD
jgi:hypothetical protein